MLAGIFFLWNCSHHKLLMREIMTGTICSASRGTPRSRHIYAGGSCDDHGWTAIPWWWRRLSFVAGVCWEFTLMRGLNDWDWWSSCWKKYAAQFDLASQRRKREGKAENFKDEELLSVDWDEYLLSNLMVMDCVGECGFHAHFLQVWVSK